jgi:threonine-phosphate decarboxylase
MAFGLLTERKTMNGTGMEPHGGNIYRASKKYGIAAGNILDFSSNINPLGIPEELKRLLATGIDNLIHYPDPASTGLRKNISRYLKVSPERIITGNGASEIIFLLFAILKPKRLLLCGPTFTEYEKAALAAGATVDYFPLEETADFKLDIDGLISRINQFDCVLVCNPNNPTSGLIDRDGISRILDKTKESGTTVIIDEAFIELTASGNLNSAVDLSAQYQQLFIIRAFTKIFAVPGLRLGYGLGEPELISRMWDNKLPWSVNLFADCVGEYLSQAGPFLASTSQWLRAEKEWLYRQLGKIAGVKPFPPETDFMLVKLLFQDFNAAGLKESLARQGILIRDASNFRTLNDKFFRLAVKKREDNIRLITVLQETLNRIKNDTPA